MLEYVAVLPLNWESFILTVELKLYIVAVMFAWLFVKLELLMFVCAFNENIAEPFDAWFSWKIEFSTFNFPLLKIAPPPNVSVIIILFRNVELSMFIVPELYIAPPQLLIQLSE